MTEPHWITLHRLRFDEVIPADAQNLAPPDGTECWRFCPMQALTPDLMPSFTSDTWFGLAIHDGEGAARAFFEAADERLSHIGTPVEAWHGLAQPFMHKGDVNWRGAVETDTALRTSPCKAKAPLVIITTAGYDKRDASTIPRIQRFMMGIEAVVDSYADAPGNIRVAVNNGGFDGRDGFTLSIWESDREMMTAAYRPGAHRGQMDANDANSMIDRASFTRARLMGSRGQWDGAEVLNWA